MNRRILRHANNMWSQYSRQSRDTNRPPLGTTYQWLLGINYAFRWGGLILAYRELCYDQNGDGLLQNMRFSGPAFGVAFPF